MLKHTLGVVAENPTPANNFSELSTLPKPAPPAGLGWTCRGLMPLL